MWNFDLGHKWCRAAICSIFWAVPGDAGEVGHVGVHQEHVASLHYHAKAPTSRKLILIKTIEFHLSHIWRSSFFLTLAFLPSLHIHGQAPGDILPHHSFDLHPPPPPPPHHPRQSLFPEKEVKVEVEVKVYEKDGRSTLLFIIILKASSESIPSKKTGCHAQFGPQLAYVESKSENKNLHRLKE